MADRMNGTVKWFNSEKGFGFIQPEDGSADVFVHFRQVKNTDHGRVSLDDGQQVSFEVAEGRKGLEAQNVEKI